MLLSLFVVSVFILAVSEVSENHKRKKMQNMSLEEFKEYWRTGKLPS